jgi:hypothetical protein
VNVIEVSDFRSFATSVRRSRWARLALVVLTAVLALAVVLVAPRRAAPAETLLPQGANGVVVVDVSASISWETYARIATTLERLRRDGGDAGLILFSDTAYQARARTPVAELRLRALLPDLAADHARIAAPAAAEPVDFVVQRRHADLDGSFACARRRPAGPHCAAARDPRQRSRRRRR